MNILFVCTGNSCRSPMAEILLRHMLAKEKMEGFTIASRGVGALDGQPASAGTIEALKTIGLDATRHLAQSLTRQDVEKADRIFVMEDAHWAIIASEYPQAVDKLFLLKDYAGAGSGNIADPIGGSPEDYEKCRIEIQDCLLGLLPKLKERKNKL